GHGIGPEAPARLRRVLRGTKAVSWDGPMGVFEFPAFAAGTKAGAQALTEVDGLSVVGGGHSAPAGRQLGFTGGPIGH
uniref:phosphoglycerate kinase n=1 Tax=Microbacterium sp. GbtcB4 TaxID=2824749 RepID=UPI001C30F1E7